MGMSDQNKQGSKKNNKGSGWIVALVVFALLNALDTDTGSFGVIIAILLIGAGVAAILYVLRVIKLPAKEQGTSGMFNWKNASDISNKIAESIHTKNSSSDWKNASTSTVRDSSSDWKNARPGAQEKQSQFRHDTGSSFPAYKAAPAKPSQSGVQPERQYYDKDASERIFDRDKQRRLAQLDDFLKTGIITREEYRVLKSRYEKS